MVYGAGFALIVVLLSF
ncbi:sporulation protein YjcZ [Neobacillus drentensis]